ncbi:MFS transporter [Thalassospira marina]|uniref:MFS transporter n=1 Tax=Thalassospira marina TaxID=2048283 RepID=A0A2N3KSQ5_9PROT|nr:MFS transporter [Thalassospira marina]PKR53598.1 MFS transporter [Thalassospira marina]
MSTPANPPVSEAPNPAVRWFLSLVLVTFLAASATPTPMYHLYQEDWHFSATMLTLIFAIYPFTLLISLLVLGSLSDHIGRKPVIFAALVLEILSMALFINAGSVSDLLLARVVQGFATGIATSVLAAALFDSDHHKGPLANSISPLIGLAAGALISSILVEYAPMPLHLGYWCLSALMAIQALMVWGLPETAKRQHGALKSLMPRISVPVAARQAMLEIVPSNIASWALGGFALSLAPSLIATATGSTSSLNGGIAVAVLTLAGAASVMIFRTKNPEPVLRFGTVTQATGIALILVAINSAQLWLVFAGFLVAGIGFGASFLGAVRTLVPLAAPHQRAGLMAAFYIMSYLAFSVPALLAGTMVRVAGLINTANGYGMILIALAAIALTGQIRRRNAACAAK